MEEIRQVAMHCVGRAVLFGALAISLIMLSFAFDFALAFRAGAVLSIGMAAVLIFFALTADRRDPKHSEVWLLLDDRFRPKNAPARAIWKGVMRDVYTHYARQVFFFSLGMFGVSVLLKLTGLDIGLL